MATQRDDLERLAEICSDAQLSTSDELFDFGSKLEAVLDSLVDESLVISRINGWQARCGAHLSI